MARERWPVELVFCVGLLLSLFGLCPADFSVTDLFMSTLRTHFVFACENERLIIRCPAGTLISLQNANYGRRVPSTDMCPLPWSSFGSQEYDVLHEDIHCRAADSLEIISDLCDERDECTIDVRSSLFSEDPCPTTHKYLDVSYKCKPHQFINIETCEQKHMNIYCQGKNQVIAVYNAHFGRLIQDSTTCPSYSMHDLHCQSEGALHQVMQRCHGRRQCIVKAGTKIFGDPCPEGTFKYLQVLYACVNKRIFRKPRRFPGLLPLPSNRAPEGSSTNGLGGQGGVLPPPYRTLQPSFSDSGESFSSDLIPFNESAANPNLTAIAPTGSSSKELSGFGEFINGIMIFVEFMKENKDIFVQYFVIGCLVGIILALISWVVHLRRRKAKLKKKFKSGESASGSHGGANGVLAAVQEEDRINIDEIWRSPPRPGMMNRVSPTEDSNDNTIWRSHTLPGNRQLNSYFP
ncbi:uncharacterized protein [Diadema setosum]|uniref:uncharacterized protein n=1 Tax=Diadema setosum TaxID=31175 RepID=UPI003B3B8C26